MSGQIDGEKSWIFVIKNNFPYHCVTQRWADFLSNCVILLVYIISEWVEVNLVAESDHDLLSLSPF